ncbi:MAG: DUF5722 domain-containing protein [Planctomycetota bacterium]
MKKSSHQTSRSIPPSQRLGHASLIVCCLHLALSANQTSANHPSYGTAPDTLAPDATAYPLARSKKGLQVEWIDDAIDLGVQHAAFNCVLNGLVTLNPKPNDYVWTHHGQTHHFRKSAVDALDRKITPLSRSGALVYLILLANHRGDDEIARRLVHPEFNPEAPNGMGAFQSTSAEGRTLFAATLSFLADRYGRQPFSNGRVVGFIIGNEVNSHWFWYNRGEVEPQELVDDYASMLRIASESVAAQTKSARVYVSLDHYWERRHTPTNPKKSLGSLEFLERLAAYSRAHGDFAWHVAFHPYPESLFHPAFWNDKQATLDRESPKVTPKNLSVLTDFLKEPEMLHKGSARRVILSEQGFHAKKDAQGERLQAAAYCLAYRLIEADPGIDAFILHRHIDHPREGGLNLGLWREASGSTTQPSRRAPRGQRLNEKLIYRCFRDADREHWRDTFRFALPIVGLDAWPKAL